MEKKITPIKRHSIYNNLILLCLMSVLPLLVLFFAVYFMTLDEMHKKELNTLQSILLTNKYQVENEVYRIYISEQSMITNDASMQDISYKYGKVGSYELGSIVAGVHKSLYYLKNTSGLIKNASVYFTGIEREMATNLYYNDDITSDRKQMYWDGLVSKSIMVSYSNGSMYVSSHSQKTNFGASSEFFVYSEIDLNSVKEMFSSSANDIYTIYSADQCVISNDTNQEIVDTVVKKMNGEKIVPNEMMSGDFVYQGKRYIQVYMNSSNLAGTFISYVPESVIFGNLKRFTAFVWALAAIAVVMILSLVINLYRMVKKPLEILTYVFGKVEQGSLEVDTMYESNNEFGELMHSFNAMVSRLKDSISQIYIKNTNLKIAQYKQLQAQIGPHFLYNSFNILTHSICRGKNDIALLMAKSLSKYFMYITQNNTDLDTLKNEFDFASTYIDIQKIRFGERISIDFNMIDAQNASIPVPRIIIQPLIENAYKYAFSNIDGGGELKVYWQESDGVLKITVEDNGPGVSAQKLMDLRKSLETGDNIGHNGLCNVHQRLMMQYGEEYGLTLTSEENRFFRAEIAIPSFRLTQPREDSSCITF